MSSIVLTGMPGAGKTTLGKKLASHLDLAFFDTDHLIEAQTGRPLQESLDVLGYVAMRQLECDVIAQYPWPQIPMVIATGGSAVYGVKAMEKLKSLGVCVYLKIHLETIRLRVQNWHTRGFLAPPGQSLADIFRERNNLYHQFADLVIECDELSEAQCLQALVSIYQARDHD